MKLTELLIAIWCLIIVIRSETTDADQDKALLTRAAEQLERLAPYRRTSTTDNQEEETDLAELLKNWRYQSVEQNQLDGTRSKADREEEVPWEIFEIAPEQTEESEDPTKRADGEKTITFGVLTDPKYAAMMQERIKRGFDSGTASLLTSIAGGVLSGVASASSSSAGKALAGSSEAAYKPVYGAPTVEHTYSYGEKPFGPWDFKKAIFGTLFQAIKAIGGGVLALKGQLVKGGGYLLAGKAKIVSKAGDVITSFGKQLAASSVTEPKPYPPDAYYDHPPVHGHNPGGYRGPSPSNDYSEASNDYSPHETYGVPADDDNQGGLLIVMPTKSDLDGHDDQHANVAAVQGHPDSIKLEESFGGFIKKPIVTNLLNSLPSGSVGTKDQAVVVQDNSDNVDPYPPTQHPVPIYGAPNHYSANNHGDHALDHAGNPTPDYGNPQQNYEQNYHTVHDNVHQQPELPQITSSHHHLPPLDDPSLFQPGLNYPLHQIPYVANGIEPHHDGSLPLHTPKLPYDDGDGTSSMYASLSVDTEPQVAPYKVSLLDKPNALDLPKLQPHVDFHGGQSQFANYLHGSLGGPLRVPLLSPMPSAYYWQSQGSVMPASPFNVLDYYRKKDVLQRRAFAKRLALYSSLPRTRFHPL